MGRNRTIGDLLNWLSIAPAGTHLDAAAVVELLRPIAEAAPPPPAPAPAPVAELTWRERLWTVPAETRLGREEVCEAFNRPKSWLYRHTSGKTIPFRKLDGELYFLAGELRAWAREREEVIMAGPMDSPASERTIRSIPRAG